MYPAVRLDGNRIFQVTLTVIVFGLFFTLLYYLRTVLIPFAVALILADILDPVVDIFERLKLPRGIAIIVVFLIIFTVISFALFWGIPYIINELRQFSSVFPDYIMNIYNFLSQKFGEHISKDYVNKLISNLQSTLIIERLMNYIAAIFSKIVNLFYGLVAVVVMFMYTFYLLKDIDRIRERWNLYIPETYRLTVQMVVKDTYHFITTFFRGQLIIAAILSVLFAVGFSIVDIRLSILLGFIAGFLNLIPNFGTIIALIPALLLAMGRALEEGEDPLMRIIGILLVFISTQVVQDFILTPTIMGKKTGLRPATILLSVFIWGKLLGFLGILLAIPLTCLTKVYFSRFILKKEIEVV